MKSSFNTRDTLDLQLQQTARTVGTCIRFSSETVQTGSNSSVQEAGTAKNWHTSFLQKSQKYDCVLFCNTVSFMCSITLFEKDCRPSQGQQEAVSAEVALVVNESVANEAVVSDNIASASSPGSQSRFFTRFSSGCISSNSSDTHSVSVL